MNIRPLGDSAVVATLGDSVNESILLRVRALADSLREAQVPGVIDVVPAYASVTVFYDPTRLALSGARPYPTIAQLIEWCAARCAPAEPEAPSGTTAERCREIPVAYGGQWGPDLAEVARHCGLSQAEVIARHAGAEYRVHAMGFVPGFAYLGGLPKVLQIPRLPTPRTEVAPGSVGITGAQSAVYPVKTPGGWRLIGRTPLRLFDPGAADSCFLRTGDRVVFRPITGEEFAAWS